MASRRATGATIALLCVICLAVGACVGLLLAPTPIPDVLQPESGPSVVEVVPQDFQDDRVLSLTATLSAKQELASAAQGVVRSTHCSPGAVIESGSVLFVVDNRPVIALHLDSPPWRDLAWGTIGDDVSDFQRELNRLGYVTPITGEYYGATADVVKELWAAVGVNGLSNMPMDRIVWLPAATQVPSECLTQVGDTIGPGSPVLIAGGNLTQLQVSIPTTATVGSRLAIAGESVTTEIGADGIITDPEFLTAYATRRDYHQWLADGTTPLTVKTSLATPIRVIAVSPTSLYSLNGRSACLVDGKGQAHAVDIIASQLGETFVTAPTLPSHVTMPAPQEAPSCV